MTAMPPQRQDEEAERQEDMWSIIENSFMVEPETNKTLRIKIFNKYHSVNFLNKYWELLKSGRDQIREPVQ